MEVVTLWTKKKGHEDEFTTKKQFATMEQLKEYIEGWGPGSLNSLMRHNVSRENYLVCAAIRDEINKIK